MKLQLQIFFAIFQKRRIVNQEIITHKNFNICRQKYYHLLDVSGNTRCDQKVTVIFKLRELRMLDFRIFLSVMFMIHMSIMYIC